MRSWRGVTARYAQAQGTAPSIRQDVNLGAETAPAAVEDRLRLFIFGRARRAHMHAPDRAVQPHGGQIRIGLHVGSQAQPDAPVAPGRQAALDRVPLPGVGQNRYPEKNECGAIGYQSSGGCPSRKHAKGRIAGRLTAGAQDVQDNSTLPRLQGLHNLSLAYAQNIHAMCYPAQSTHPSSGVCDHTTVIICVKSLDESRRVSC